MGPWLRERQAFERLHGGRDRGAQSGRLARRPENVSAIRGSLELGDEFHIVAPTKEECAAAANTGRGRGGPPGDGSDNAFSNTTIAVVATDAPLEDLEAERMAVIANDGLARAIKPIHGIGDGDTIFGLATTPPSHNVTNRSSARSSMRPPTRSAERS